MSGHAERAAARLGAEPLHSFVTENLSAAIKALGQGYTVRGETIEGVAGTREYVCWRDRPGLSERMRQALDFIEEASAVTGVSPSYAEIAVALGHNSKSEVARLVTALVTRGYLARRPYCARSLAVLP